MKFLISISIILILFTQQAHFSLLKSVLGVGLERPDYEVLKRLDDKIEIRKYEPTKWAAVSTQTEAKNMKSKQSPMFRQLYNYISGDNDAQMKMEMTVPVTFVMESLQDKSKKIDFDTTCDISMRFYVPKKHQSNTPKPNGDVKLEDEAEATYAVIKFGGYAKMSDYLSYRDQLIEKLGDEAKNYDLVNMRMAGYDAPFKFFDRTNEVWLKRKV
jgi:hypothetical protein